MAAEILTQPTHCLTEGSTSFAELGVLYGEKGVAEAQARLQVVLAFKSIRPKLSTSTVGEYLAPQSTNWPGKLE